MSGELINYFQSDLHGNRLIDTTTATAPPNPYYPTTTTTAPPSILPLPGYFVARLVMSSFSGCTVCCGGSTGVSGGCCSGVSIPGAFYVTLNNYPSVSGYWNTVPTFPIYYGSGEPGGHYWAGQASGVPIGQSGSCLYVSLSCLGAAAGWNACLSCNDCGNTSGYSIPPCSQGFTAPSSGTCNNGSGNCTIVSGIGAILFGGNTNTCSFDWNNVGFEMNISSCSGGR